MHKKFNTNQNQRKQQWETGNLRNFTSNRDSERTDLRRRKFAGGFRTSDVSLGDMRRKRKGLGRDYWIATETELWYFFYYSQWSSTTRFYDLRLRSRNPTLHMYRRSNGSVFISQGLRMVLVKLIWEIGPLIIYTILEGSLYGNVLNHSPTIWLLI